LLKSGTLEDLLEYYSLLLKCLDRVTCPTDTVVNGPDLNTALLFTCNMVTQSMRTDTSFILYLYLLLESITANKRND